MIHIAVDAMGGDHAPGEVVQGACEAVRELPIRITLVGIKDRVVQELEKHHMADSDRITVQHATEVVEMCELPAVSFRKKKDSSIRVGLDLLKDKKVDGFVSAGNTGAVMTTSVLVLGKIDNIDRPAIATIIPSQIGPVVMLDMGSNVDAKPDHLTQYAIMGHYFAQLLLDISDPRVGLLNIGEEKDKGNQVSQMAYDLIAELPVNFVGNVEGKDIVFGKADVVVCDGFVGNALLKFGEGISELFFNFFRHDSQASLMSKIGLFCLRPALTRFVKQFNYEETGGAPLLGVNGVSFIAHGKSKSYAIKNAIKTTVHAIERQMVERIATAVNQ